MAASSSWTRSLSGALGRRPRVRDGAFMRKGEGVSQLARRMAWCRCSSGGAGRRDDGASSSDVKRLGEAQWRDRWAKLPRVDDDRKSSLYCLCMFPYPSGNLHLGHVRVYALGDVLARAHRMQGRNVLFPMGWDAFGLPAENAAVERGVDPVDWTRKNISQMKGQLECLGLSFDWDRELSTCDPSYFRWTQWLFLKLFNDGVAYQGIGEVNWDPIDKTVLANEQVDGSGRSWRSGALVEKRQLRQWYLRITDFAPALLRGLDAELAEEWPERVRSLQREWIGQSKGATVRFQICDSALGDTETSISVFTTRPETISGVTFLAVSPNHPVAKEQLPTLDANSQSELLAMADGHEVGGSIVAGHARPSKGVFLGITALHPLSLDGSTAETIPVFAAPYVLDGYGEGAVMGVPAHDERDLRFAEAHDIKVIQAVDENQNCLLAAPLIPDNLVGMPADGEGRQAIIEMLEMRGCGEAKTTLKLRDWLVSRQRRWGAPIPIIHCQTCGPVGVPEASLPVTHIEIDSPDKVTCPNCSREDCRRETDTLDTFVDSSWYFLRFCDPSNKQQAFEKSAVENWMGKRGVDLYIGGIEHAILHLLYARFINRFLHERVEGIASSAEPFKKLITQGMVLGKTAKCATTGRYLKPGHIESVEDVHYVWEKMSKSKHNGVDPVDLVGSVGADATRLAILFAAPPDLDLEWDQAAISGQTRFLNRLRTLVQQYIHDNETRGPVDTLATKQLERERHAMVLQISDLIMEKQSLNVAIARLMEMANTLQKAAAQNASLEERHRGLSSLVRMLAPFAPHTADELWHSLNELDPATNHMTSVHLQTWPVADAKTAADTNSLLVVLQVKGKKRAVINIDTSLGLPSKDQVLQQVHSSQLFAPLLEKNAGKPFSREIVVLPKKLGRGNCIVNFVP